MQVSVQNSNILTAAGEWAFTLNGEKGHMQNRRKALNRANVLKFFKYSVFGLIKSF